MTHRSLLAALGFAHTLAALATTVPLPTDAQWHVFRVAPDLAAGLGLLAVVARRRAASL